MKYFGTDGIRGIAYKELTVDLAYKVGESLGLFNIDKLVIGLDTRESSRNIADSLIKGALNVGINVFDLGVIPTPGLIIESYYRKSIGVMITASHNPYTDNGIKIVKYGYKIDDRDKQIIEDYIDGVITYSHKLDGKYTKEESKYIEFLSNNIIRTKLNVVIDSANGAASNYVSIFDKMANVKYLSNTPNGKNINLDCGATHLDNLINNMNGFDLGIAFDGDADRIMVIDDKKNIVDGDKLIYLFAKWFKKHDLLKNDGIVLTVMSNLGVINKLKDEGFNVILTNVGDQNVFDGMIKNEFNLGGENSGHIITPLSLTGDGLLNAIILLTIISEENKSLYELTKDIYMYPYKMVNIKVKDKNVINSEHIQNEVKKMEESFSNYGKIILRASGTEPLIRITVMHKDNNVLEKSVNCLVDLVNKEVI